MSFILKHFFISVAVFTQAVSASLRRNFEIKKLRNFENFVFELEAFSIEFKFDYIHEWQLMSPNKNMVLLSGIFNVFISCPYLHSFNSHVAINES